MYTTDFILIIPISISFFNIKSDAFLKKGNLQLKTNYRGISLMSIAAKVYNKAILNRILLIVDQILRRNQAGFRKGRSCTQQIHIIRRLIEGAIARKLPLFITSISKRCLTQQNDHVCNTSSLWYPRQNCQCN